MNVKLLEKVKAAILAEPAQFVMDDYFAIEVNGKEGDDVARSIPNCGTAACIAGWAATLSGRFKNPAMAHRRRGAAGIWAAMALGLDAAESGRLFLVSEWPDRYAERWYDNRRLKARARIAAQRIDRFIATDGRE